MKFTKLFLISGLLSTAAFNISSAELVKVSDQPAIPKSIGLEMNHGQSSGEVLFLHRSPESNLAITPQAVLYSPINTQLKIVGGESNPLVTYGDTIPNAVNVYHGADESKWLTGIPVHGWARLNNVYPGISLEYKPNDAGQLVMKWIIQPEGDPEKILLEYPDSIDISQTLEKTLIVRLDQSRISPTIRIPAAVAYQSAIEGDPELLQKAISFRILSPKQFGFTVESRDPTLPLTIEILLINSGSFALAPGPVIDEKNNYFVAENINDAAGKAPPFTSGLWGGCGIAVESPIPCTDSAITKYSAQGKLLFRTYLSGTHSEQANYLNLTSTETIQVTGSVSSQDFPVSATAHQRNHAGPAPVYDSRTTVTGDFFASTLDSSNGHLKGSTYLGGPEADLLEKTETGQDGSIYLIAHRATKDLPVSGSPLSGQCPGNPCLNGYAARLSDSLDQLVYGTYLPGFTRATQVDLDGSLYFSGSADPGFPTTPDAYQTSATERKAFIARLLPTGNVLTFGTYYNKSGVYGISEMAVAGDGSVWASVSLPEVSTPQFSYTKQNLIRISADGKKLLHESEISTPSHLGVDHQGNLITTSNYDNITASPNSLLSQSCGSGSFTRRNPEGETVFATYLPAHYSFSGVNGNNELLLRNPQGTTFRLDESRASFNPFAGCVVDGAQFAPDQPLSAGEIVSIFGKNMGPEEGVAFELVNDKLPTTLGKTQVLVNGEPASLLYVSAAQINLILPFSLEVGSSPTIQVITPLSALSTGKGNVISSYSAQAPAIHPFRIYGEIPPLAAALNQDGSVNSRENPAVLGSVIALFATGGGQTEPASMAGEVTPLSLYPLAERNINIRVNGAGVNRGLEILYAGGAPGLVAGVNQINIRLPEELPESIIQEGVLSFTISSPGSSSTAIVAVKQPE